MGEKQYSPVTQYLCGMQSVFFQHSPPVTSSGYTWHHPIHSETSHIPLQFTGQVRPTPLNVIPKPYITLNQALGLNQENIQILSGPVWDQARPWPNKVQVVAQSQGRPILGVHNQEHITTDFMNKAEKRADIMPDTTNCTDWVSGNSNYTRECLGYSAVLKRPHPSTPDPRQKKSCHKIYQIVTDPSRNSHSRAPYKCLGVNTSIPPPVIPQRNSSHQENKESSERYFKTLATSPSNPVELHVTNLDQSIDSLELKEILMAAFREHIMVLHLSIFVQSDGNLAASVKVPSVQDAQYAISQLHRRKVGYKRIVIAYAHSGSSQNPQFIRTQIYSLLSEVPGYRLPLFTFRDLFESRYLTSLSVSELYRMRDICIITDENSGRTIYLNPEYRSTPSPRMFTSNNEIGQHNMEVPYCIRHGHSQQLSCEKGWAEQELPTLPNIRVKLSEFSSNIQALLRSHNDFLPLASLMDCYAGEFETLTVDETGVPLEHLVTWVPNVELAVNLGCVKYLRPAESKPSQPEKVEDGIKKCASPSLANQLSLFSHELVDLLKTQPKNNQLMFNRFIPAYHHHFGRQCRVADYGFTKLIDLFEALPHVIQVIGEGNKRIVALAHHAQIRRFTSDLLRVIKSQANKQLKVSELSFLFGVTLGRVFDPVDYGLCYLEDLLAQLSENIVVVSGTGTSTLIAIPKREQTSEEIERTKRFALEVVELLSHAPQCSMFFSKFIPAYHHHYGHQCRVLDYGFPKLIDLFEAIPHIVKIEDSRERERRVTLTNDKKIMVLNNQIVDLVCANYPPGLPISSLNNAFLRQFGYALKPMAYGCDNLEQLIEKLQASFKVVNFGKEPLLTPGNQTQLHQLSLRIFRILMVNDDAKMTCLEFYQAYESLYNESCCLELLENELNDFIKMTHRGIATVELTNLQLFARNVYKILYMADGRLARNSFDATYFNMFGKVIKPSQYNCQSVNALLNAISHVVVQGKGAKHILILNEELGSVGISLPPGFQRSSSNQNVAKPFQNGSSTESQHDSQADSLKQNSPPQKQKALIQALNNCQDHDSKDSKSSADLEKIWPNNSTTCFIYDGQVPVINLPEPCTPPDPEVCASLYSPYKILLPANPFYYSTPRMKRIISPHPSELVLPPSYLTNSNPEPITEGDESADSGLVTSATDLVPDCDSGSNSSMSTLSNNGKRKVRLAAQFNIPLD